MDRGAWWAMSHGATKSLTRLSDQHIQFSGGRQPPLVGYLLRVPGTPWIVLLVFPSIAWYR